MHHTKNVLRFVTAVCPIGTFKTEAPNLAPQPRTALTGSQRDTVEVEIEIARWAESGEARRQTGRQTDRERDTEREKERERDREGERDIATEFATEIDR